MARIVYVNGAFVPEHEAKVSVFDRGYLFADGVYEVTAVVNGRLIDLEPHLERLERSLKAIHMVPPMSRQALTTLHEEVVARNGLDEGVVYLQVTRGCAEREFPYPADLEPSVVLFTQSKRLINNPLAERGVAVVTVPDLRWARRDIKSVALLPQVLAKQRAVEAEAFEAWMYDADGITEGGSSSAYIVTHAGEIITRANSTTILPGVTRRALLRLAERCGYRLVERPFTVEEAQNAAEALLTSASSFVLPVVRVDDQSVNGGRPGPVTRELRQLYLHEAGATLSAA